MQEVNLRYLIVDLEATCWEKGSVPSRMETIEIGTVLLATAKGPIEREFDTMVRPVAEPILSAFCTALTSIRQHEVDAAETFPNALQRMLDWVGDAMPFTWCSWGAYDLKQLRSDCRRHRMALPAVLENHINLKREFARLIGIKPPTMKQALRLMSIRLEGRHHRGIDDARNIAKLACWILPRLLDGDAADDSPRT